MHVSAGEGCEQQEPAGAEDSVTFGEEAARRIEPLYGRGRCYDIEALRMGAADLQFGVATGEACAVDALRAIAAYVPEIQETVGDKGGESPGEAACAASDLEAGCGRPREPAVDVGAVDVGDKFVNDSLLYGGVGFVGVAAGVETSGSALLVDDIGVGYLLKVDIVRPVEDHDRCALPCALLVARRKDGVPASDDRAVPRCDLGVGEPRFWIDGAKLFDEFADPSRGCG